MKGQITMAKKSKVCLHSDRAKEFEKEFERLAYQHGAWKVWQDFIDLCAISISNVLDKREGIWKEREKFFLSVKDSYTDEDYEVFARLFALVAKALNENPEQDFLGNLYMSLNFGDGGVLITDNSGRFCTLTSRLLEYIGKEEILGNELYAGILFVRIEKPIASLSRL